MQYESGTLVIRYNNTALVPSGEFTVQESIAGEDDDEDEFLWWYGLLIAVGAVVILLLIVVLFIVSPISCCS